MNGCFIALMKRVVCHSYYFVILFLPDKGAVRIPGQRIFNRSIKLFLITMWGCKNIKRYFMECRTICLKTFTRRNQSALKSKMNRNLEMINHLTGMKIAWENLSHVRIYFKRPEGVLDGVPYNVVER